MVGIRGTSETAARIRIQEGPITTAGDPIRIVSTKELSQAVFTLASIPLGITPPYADLLGAGQSSLVTILLQLASLRIVRIRKSVLRGNPL